MVPFSEIKIERKRSPFFFIIYFKLLKRYMVVLVSIKGMHTRKTHPNDYIYSDVMYSFRTTNPMFWHPFYNHDT